MKIKAKFMQEGGAMPAEQGAPAAQAAPEADGEQDVMAQMVQMAAQALQSQDCNAAMQVCQILVQLVQQSQAPAEEQPGEPVYRRGGTLVKRIKK